MKKSILALTLTLLASAAQAQWQTPTNTIPYGRGVGTGFNATGTQANGVLITNGSSVPSLSQTLPNAVQDLITRLGTVTVGSIPATLLTGTVDCARFPALTGDITTSAGSCATAIAAGVIVNADINAAAAIAWSKVATTGAIVNADVNASAAIAFSKLAALSANQVLGALTATTPSGLSVPSCSAAASALTWTSGVGFGCNTIASGGTVTNVVANGVTITTTGTVPPITGLQNHSLAVSAAGSALTIALKDSAGSDPSAASPVNGWFRNATGTTGSWSQLTVTSALSLTVSSGSTLGISSSVAFRLWVVLFNDGGTARLGVINCYDGNVDIYPLQPGQVASSTAEGGAGAADSSGIFYTGTAVASKAYHIVGYIEWNTSGVTAGTWTTTNINFVTAFGFDTPLPGHIVQQRRNHVGSLATGTTTIPGDDTIPQITEGTEFMTQPITPTSAANMLKITSRAQLTNSGTGQLVSALFQDATANALAIGANSVRNADDNNNILIQWCMRAMTTSSTTFRTRGGLNNAGTTTFNGSASTRQYGGAMNSFMEVVEIMT